MSWGVRERVEEGKSEDGIIDAPGGSSERRVAAVGWIRISCPRQLGWAAPDDDDGWGVPFWEKPTMTKSGSAPERGNLGRAEAGSGLMQKAKKEDEKDASRKGDAVEWEVRMGEG